ncbi:ESCRT-0 subunit protein hse1, partial [Ascosphaera acerosa]
MFRSSTANEFDEPVAKATDETLTSENWEYILIYALEATPHQVKANVFERLEAWSSQFASSPELGLMGEAYSKLKHQ